LLGSALRPSPSQVHRLRQIHVSDLFIATSIIIVVHLFLFNGRIELLRGT